MNNFKNKLPDMKFQYKETVKFLINNEEKIGTILVCDYGGAFEHDNHSYDVLVKNDTESCLYKHIKEVDLKKVMK